MYPDLGTIKCSVLVHWFLCRGLKLSSPTNACSQVRGRERPRLPCKDVSRCPHQRRISGKMQHTCLHQVRIRLPHSGFETERRHHPGYQWPHKKDLSSQKKLYMHWLTEWGCGPICAEIKVMHCLMDHSPCTVGGLPVVPEHAEGPVLVHVAHLSLQQQVSCNPAHRTESRLPAGSSPTQGKVKLVTGNTRTTKRESRHGNETLFNPAH